VVRLTKQQLGIKQGTTIMKVVVYRKNSFWRVKLVSTNGKTMLVSETYYSRSNAVRAAQRLRELL
jgi:uncharacterized protein YegP (UPF0339 family)